MGVEQTGFGAKRLLCLTSFEARIRPISAMGPIGCPSQLSGGRTFHH